MFSGKISSEKGLRKNVVRKKEKGFRKWFPEKCLPEKGFRNSFRKNTQPAGTQLPPTSFILLASFKDFALIGKIWDSSIIGKIWVLSFIGKIWVWLDMHFCPYCKIWIWQDMGEPKFFLVARQLESHLAVLIFYSSDFCSDLFICLPLSSHRNDFGPGLHAIGKK